ncbi:MAG: T9SS type A sorting domain-containing protein [Flavobacteriales bacterium]|nr:T9SS type A sorting domain-containing protein [Flavobacteriales bacterium]MBP9177425.1 T9SS type A sorting domain-containing protein [Flavobacteriales bacterium]
MRITNQLRSGLRISTKLVLATMLTVQTAHAQSGSLDGTFTVGTGVNGRLFAMAAQPDGKQVIGGAFTTYNGVARNRIARINRNGTLDASFVVGSGVNGQVTAVAIDASDKVLIGGSFTTYNGSAAMRLVRVNANGSIDPSFNTGSGIPNGSVSAIQVQKDGRILVVGSFNQVNGTATGRIVRLNSDGSIDTGYTTGLGANGDIYGAALDNSGKLVVVGAFTSMNGVMRPGIARLRTDGELDISFNPGAGPNAAVYCVAHQRDGKILIGGLFTSYNGSTPASRIARLERNGSYDNSFSIGTGFNSWVYTIAFQGDGKILAGGDFTMYNGTARNRLVRLQTNGVLDTGFSTGSTCSNWVYAITWQPEGRITVGGGFTSYNGTARNRILRLNSTCDENIQLTLRTDAFGSQTSWEITGAGFTYPLCSGSGFANNTEVNVGCCLPHGCLRLRVLDSAGDGMSSGGYVLKDGTGRRIIDNTNDGIFGSESSIAANGSFCLPMSADRPIMTACDKLDWVYSDFMIASPLPDVSAQWGIGDQTDDGYEFWFYDPDGTYSQRKFRSHALPGGYGSGALRTCYQRLSWTPNTNPIPEGVLLNVRIRGRVNGVNNEWGPACRMKVDPITAACPPTKLVDIPSQRYFSCGVTRSRAQFVSAKTVPNANRFEFEFVNTADGYSYSIQRVTYHCFLNWASPALVPGHTYQVRVRASKDNGLSWCPWGETCQVTIAPNVAPEEGPQSLALENGDLDMTVWPNPSAGDRMEINLNGITREVEHVDVVVYDAMGKLVHQERLAVEGPQWRGALPFTSTLPDGQYLLRVNSGEQTMHQRFVVAR